MALIDDFDILAPEFEGEETEVKQKFLDWAALQVNRRVFGAKADLATLYMAAHMLAKANGVVISSDSIGAVQSEKIADLTTTYATTGNNSMSSDLSKTSYGIEFAALMKTVITTPLVV